MDAWLLTAFEEPRPKRSHPVRFFAYQRESVGGKDFWMIYAEFSEEVNLSTAKGLMGLSSVNCAAEIARAPREACIAYCTKQATRVGGPWEWEAV